jgi:predicted DsbA family dithiol-disulfide isomerase
VRTVEVFADVACPFTHVGLRQFVARRRDLGLTEPVLRLRAWPLELVNDAGLDGAALVPKVRALQMRLAPDLFAGFDPETFPRTSLPAMAAEAAAYRFGAEIGEQVSLGLRDLLFERGTDISDPDVLRSLLAGHGIPAPSTEDEQQVRADYEEGKRRGVVGSPHFFTPEGSDFFCPSLAIGHQGERLEVTFDSEGFTEFISAAFA